MMKVMATSWKGGTRPDIAVNRARVDQSRIAQKPMRVAVREVMEVRAEADRPAIAGFMGFADGGIEAC